MAPRGALTRRGLLGGAACVPAAGLLAACTGGGDASEAGPAAASGVRPVRVATGAFFNSWESYLYVAEDRGWWREAGFEVEVVPGAGTGGNLALLAEGQADFAALDVNAAIIRYETGEPTGTVLTCVLHRNLLGCVLAPASSGIEQLRDLEGRTVAVLEGGVNTVVFPALGALTRFDVDKVQRVSLDLPFFPHYQSGSVDAGLEFLPSRAWVEQILGEPVTVIPYSDWLPELYGSAVGCTRELAEADPDAVRRFGAVSVRAMQWSVEHPDEAAQAYVARHADDDPAVVAEGLRDLGQFVGADPGLEPGQFDENRLAEGIATLSALGALGTGPTITDHLDELFLFDLYS